MTGPRILVTGFSKRFAATAALTDVSLELLPGEAHAVVGANGTGNSTLVGILARVHQPDAGDIRRIDPCTGPATGVHHRLDEVFRLD